MTQKIATVGLLPLVVFLAALLVGGVAFFLNATVIENFSATAMAYSGILVFLIGSIALASQVREITTENTSKQMKRFAKTVLRIVGSVIMTVIASIIVQTVIAKIQGVESIRELPLYGSSDWTIGMAWLGLILFLFFEIVLVPKLEKWTLGKTWDKTLNILKGIGMILSLLTVCTIGIFWLVFILPAIFDAYNIIVIEKEEHIVFIQKGIYFLKKSGWSFMETLSVWILIPVGFFILIRWIERKTGGKIIDFLGS